MRKRKPQTDAQGIARIRSRCVVNEQGCWIWKGASLPGGYGKIKFRKRYWVVSRLMFELVNGRQPKGDAGHTCEMPSCVNPDHLKDQSKSENMIYFWRPRDNSAI